MPTFRPRPAFLSDVLNAAAFFGLGPVAPGELISLTGIGLGPESGMSYKPTPDGSALRELGRSLVSDGLTLRA